MAEQIPFSIVENVLSSLGSSVVQKLGTMYGVQNELKKLQETLGTLNAMLLDAEEQLEKSHAVKDWVKRVKGVVYDVDDLLDDFATYRLRRGGAARQVSHFFSSSNQVAFRFQMSGRVEGIKEALDDLKKDIFLLGAIPRNTVHQRVKNIRRETHSSPSTSNLDLRNAKIGEIVSLLVSPDNDQDIFIVVICGIGGMGKTTLAQSVYNDERVKKHFEPKIWVCVSDVSGEGFDEDMLLKKITKSKDDERGKIQSLDDSKNELHNKLSQNKYLLVLDDVWNNQTDNWEKLRTLLEVGANGSKILVTTRNTEVSFMGKNTVPIKLEALSKEESLKLFSDITFGGRENTTSEEKEKIIEVGKEIVNMCNGVPLIIKTLGRTLMQSKSDLSKWLSIRKNENLLSLPYGNDNVLRVLKLSYENLPTHLKQCFTYCALFPKDYEIEKKLLVQLWIAQGYIQSTNGNEQLEDIGDDYFKELLSRSLLEEVEKDDFGNILSCKMHDLIHDLAQSIVGSEVLVLRSDIGNIPEEVRHITLGEENPMMKTIKGKPIRTFFNPSEYPIETSTIKSFLPSFICLRVLCLNDLNMEKVPKCLGKLSHLRYLDLSYNRFKVLPNSITRLKNLQTLKLRCCWDLKKFPRSMRELINLRHLENDECDDLSHMPHGIGKLTLLQSLPLFVIGNDIGWLRNHKVGSLSELESLDHLRGELHIKDLQNVRDVELVSRQKILEKKEYLESLRLEWRGSEQNRVGEGDKWVMEGLQPNRQLKELFIEGYGAKVFPSWMMNDELASRLPSLIEIEIRGCSRCNTLPPFSQLPSLKSLTLYDMKEVEELKEGSSAMPLFQFLESLKLSCMPKLKELWRMEGPSFSVIDDCSKLASLELHSFPSLSELEINKCNNFASLELHSSPSLFKLKINECNNLASLQLHSSPSLSELEINKCNNLASLELHSSPFLSQLEIRGCSNLTSLELHSSPNSLSRLDIKKCLNLASFKVAPFSSLETISLSTVGYDVIQQIKFVSASSSLKFLSIGGIHDMISLPRELLQHCSSLVTLRIRACPNLQSLELLSSHGLSGLRIVDCPNLTSINVASLTSLEELTLSGVRSEVLRQLIFVSASSSLKFLHICEIDGMIADPEEEPGVPLQYFSTIETLYIKKCSGLTTLLHWMGNLSLLTELVIYDCPELTSLPEPIYSLENLQKLYLCDSPHIQQRYNKETGEDQAKIAHIPHVYFHLSGLMKWKVRNP